MSFDNLAIGGVFQDRYVIIKKLGDSGHSISYRARDKLIGREVALEVFELGEEMDANERTLFIKDITIAGKLVHPAIRLIYNSEVIGTGGYISQEFVRGYNLRKILDMKPVLKPEIALHILSQVAQALQHAHRKDIVHKYVQPRIIYITNQGRVKLSDFGRQRFLQFHATLSLTRDFKPPLFVYNAPEVLAGQSFSEKADIYSAGVTLYEMLCGRVPFHSLSYNDFFEELKQFSIISPHRLNPNVSLEIDAIIVKAMAKSPDDRYASIDDLLKAIEPHLIPVTATQILEGLDDIEMEFGDQVEEEEKTPREEDRVVHIQRDEDARAHEAPSKDVIHEAPKPVSGARSGAWSKLVLTILSVIILGGAAIGAYLYHSKSKLTSLLKEADRLMMEDVLVLADRTGAYSRYQEVLRLDPGNEYARQKMRDISVLLTRQVEEYRKTGEWTQARETIELLIATSPDNQNLLKMKDEIVEQEKLHREEEAQLRKIADLLAKTKQAITDKQWEVASQTVQEVLNVRPKEPDALLAQAAILDGMGRTDEAIGAYRSFISLFPERIEGYTELGIMYRKQNELEKAEQQFRLAVEKQPDLEGVHFNLASVMQLQGKTEEAIQEFQAEIANNESAFSHFNLGYLYQVKKDTDKAIEHYQRAIALKPDLQAAYYNLGYMFYRQKRYEEARETLNKVLILFPDYYKAKNLLDLVTKSLPADTSQPSN